jgi:hypothetical protein
VIFKRTKSVSIAWRATGWVKSYLDETEKHKGKDLSMIGLQIGKNYFTSRPSGQLSAHGYLKGQIEALKLTHHLDDNQAILKFVEHHCRRQRRKGRRILGLRAIASLDPKQVSPLITRMVDLDLLLEQAVERTFNTLAERFYPGDEVGYFLGIHHDRHHLHGHLFILPQTRNGLRLSLSNHTNPGRDTAYVDMLDQAREIYATAAQQLIYSQSRPTRMDYVSPIWTSLAKDLAAQTVDDFQSGQEMTPESGRKFGVNRFFYFVRTTHQEGLARRVKRRKERIAELSERGGRELIDEVRQNYQAVNQSMLGPLAQRAAVIDPIIQNYRENSSTSNVRHSILAVPRAQLVSYRVAPSRVEMLKNLSKEVALRRLAARITVLGEVANMELLMAAARGPNAAPAWLEMLEGAIQSGAIPNQQMVELEVPASSEQQPAPMGVIVQPGDSPAGAEPFARQTR